MFVKEKKISLLLFIIGIIIVTIILFVLFIHFKKTIPISFIKNGGFNRKNTSIGLTLKNNVSLPSDFYSIIGFANQRIYLRGFNTNQIISFSENTPNIDAFSYNLSNILKKEEITDVFLNHFNKTLEVTSGNKKIIFQIDLINKKLLHTWQVDQYFSKSIIMQGDSMVLEIQKGKTLKTTLALYKLINNKAVKIKESNINFNLYDDGSLKQITDNKLLFVPYYYNKFYCFNYNLNLLFRGKTIDTVKTPPDIIYSKTLNMLTFIQTPRLVNARFLIIKNKLLIQSLIAADNDYKDVFKENCILDIYDIKNGYKYIKSLYLPTLKSEKCQDIFISGKAIFLVFSKSLLIYEMENEI
jgi:hypothetical protein